MPGLTLGLGLGFQRRKKAGGGAPVPTDPSDILIDNDTVSVSATTGTVVGKLSTVGGMAPITFEIIA